MASPCSRQPTHSSGAVTSTTASRRSSPSLTAASAGLRLVASSDQAAPMAALCEPCARETCGLAPAGLQPALGWANRQRDRQPSDHLVAATVLVFGRRHGELAPLLFSATMY